MELDLDSSKPHNCCSRQHVIRGLWTPEEDNKLKDFMLDNSPRVHSWSEIPLLAGLQRCGKSCRFRWMNHLRPDLKRGNITEEEGSLIHYLQQTIGNRWVEIASHLPGRSDSEVKNYWHSTVKKWNNNWNSSASPSPSANVTASWSINNNPQLNYQGNPNFNFNPQFGQFFTPSPQFNHHPVLMNFGSGEFLSVTPPAEPRTVIINSDNGGDKIEVNARQEFSEVGMGSVDPGPTIDGAQISSELVVPEHEFPDDITAVDPLEIPPPPPLPSFNFPPADPTSSSDWTFLGGETFFFPTDDQNWRLD